MRRFTIPALALLALGFFAGGVPTSAAAEVPGLHLVESAIGLGPAADGSPVRVNTFYKGENVKFYVKVTVDSTPGAAGDHRLVYKWYTGDALAASFDGHKTLGIGPTDWWAYINVSHLTPGPHRGELYVDDQLFANGEFEISPAARPYEPVEDTALKTAHLALLLNGDVQQIDALATQFRISQERTSSGTWKLTLLYNAIEDKSFPPADPRWKQLEDLSAAWLEKQPESPTAVALAARILYSHAWAWRNHDNADRMPPEDREQYEQLTERARAILDQHAAIAQQDPEWDTLRISIARQQGAATDEILAMADRALQRWPYFYAIHNATTNALLPQWGGSRTAIETYANLAVERSRAQEGTEAYARICYYIARTSSNSSIVDELNRTGCKYLRFQQSMGEILKKYPTDFNRDIARNLAYLAGDEAAYRSFGRASTNGVIPVAWWDSGEWRKWANEWAFEGKHHDFSPLQRLNGYVSVFRGRGPEFWVPLRWAALGAVLLIEVGFKLLGWLARRSRSNSLVPQFAPSEFNPLEYPRTYHVLPLESMSTRIGVWLLLFCSAAAYILTTIPWFHPMETGVVMAGLVVAAIIGALIVANVLTARIVLRADGLELRRLVGSRSIRRSDILGVRRHQPERTKTPAIAVVLHAHSGKPLWITPVLNEDERFRLWFESLPALATVEDDDGDEDEDQDIEPGARLPTS